MNFSVLCLHFLFWFLSCLILTPHVPYMNHYSRGIFKNKPFALSGPISLSKWLNSHDKEKEAQMDFWILLIVTVFLNEYNLVFLFL